MREIKINNKRIRTEEETLKQVNSLLKGVYTIVKDMDSDEIKNFVSGREAAKFIGMHQKFWAG